MAEDPRPGSRGLTVIQWTGVHVDGAFKSALLTRGVVGGAVDCCGVAVSTGCHPVTIGGDPIAGRSPSFSSNVIQVVAEGDPVDGRLLSIGGCGVAVGRGLLPHDKELFLVGRVFGCRLLT